ncbi:MAG TPA: DUF488 domain-containing protein [Croceibacterium sp.]|nr:DUF488 domain-containing protein [Croceibacterium sp.]
MGHTIRIRRIYDDPASDDGARVLVDRIWPRGVKRDEARLDLWLKDIAPSTELRKWFSHEPERFAEFKRRYGKELDGNPAPVAELRELAQRRDLTLLYSAHDERHNQAVALAEYLGKHGFQLEQAD